MPDQIPAPRPVESPEDRMRHATTEPYAAGDAAPAHRPSFATYLDASDRVRLDAEAACARQERDEALDRLRDLQAHHTELHTRLNVTENDLRSQTRAVRELTAENARLRTALDREDHAHGETVKSYEQAEQMADSLAEAIAKLTGADIGEHSSMNDPWQNALQAATEAAESTPPPGLGSSRRAQELPALVFNAISRALQDVWPISVPLPVVRERCAAAVLAALDDEQRRERAAQVPAAALLLGEQIRGEHGPEIPAEQLPVSSVIAVSNKFARAAGGQPRYARAAGHPAGGDWVRLRTGSGRQYEGPRSTTCPGDGVSGHRHDVRCVDRLED